MGLLDAVAGAVRGGAEAVGDIATSEIKTNQAARLQANQASLQAGLNQQLSDLNVTAAQRIADYQRGLQAQDRSRRAGYATYMHGAPGDNETPELDMDATADKAIAAGEGDYGDAILGAQNKSEKTVPYGGQLADRHGRVIVDNSVARGLAALISAEGKGGSSADRDMKNQELAEKIFTNNYGNRTYGIDPTTMKPNPDQDLITSARSAYQTLLAGDGGKFNPAQHLAEVQRAEQIYVPDAERRALADAQKKFPGVDPDKDPQVAMYVQRQRGAYLRAAFSAFAGGGGTPAPAAAPGPSATTQSAMAQSEAGNGLLSNPNAAPTPAPTGQGAYKEADAKSLSEGQLRRAIASPGTSAAGKAAYQAELARRGQELVQSVNSNPGTAAAGD